MVVKLVVLDVSRVFKFTPRKVIFPEYWVFPECSDLYSGKLFFPSVGCFPSVQIYTRESYFFSSVTLGKSVFTRLNDPECFFLTADLRELVS